MSRCLPAVMAAAVVVALCGSAARPARAAAPESRLGSGDTLASTASLSSRSGEFTLTMQKDGNLVERFAGVVLWSSHTAGHRGARAVMQNDGNLVVRSTTDAALWRSGTLGHRGASLALREDGNLVVSDTSGEPVWADRAVNPTLPVGKLLKSGWLMRTADRAYVLTMGTDGDLVLQRTSSKAVVWSSGTSGHTGGYAAMQTDGNLVLYGTDGDAYWASNTSGVSATGLTVTDTTGGIASVVDATTTYWSSNPIYQLLAHLNALRHANGRAPLTESADLDGVAQSWSKQMVATWEGESDHSGGCTVAHNPNLGTQVGDWRSLGENVGCGGSVYSIDVAFDGSTDHRANELSTAFTQVGLGWAESSDGYEFVTVDFRQPS